MLNKTQILYVHGGMTFNNQKDYIKWLKTNEISLDKRKKWHAEYFDKKLGKGFQIIRTRMPMTDNAKYEEWKIVFERYILFLKDNVILLGLSLGGTFLAKYLSENKFPRKILSVYLVAAPFDDTLPTEDLAGGFKLKSDLSLIEKNCKKITLLFAKGDDVVPVEHAKKYREKLENAKIIVYNHIKSHFQISEFPELVKMIREDVK